jgi:Flp pilus assembly protein TadD
MYKSCLLTIPLLCTAGCVHSSRVAHQTGPSTPPAFQRQIINAVDAGEGDPIARDLRKRVTSDPGDIKARLDLAARYQQQGFPELALEHYRFAVERAPHLSRVSLMLAKTLHDAGEQAAAIDTLVTFCKRDSTPPVELISLLGIYQDEAGDYVQAEKSYRSGLVLAPKNDSLRNNLGYNLLLQNRTADAITELRSAIALNPHSEVARNNLARALTTEPGGDNKEALLQLEAVNDAATAHSNLASIFITEKRYPEARAEIAIALSYSRSHTAALSNLAVLSELDGQPATLSAQKNGTSHNRVSTALRKAFHDSKSESGTVPVEAASK